MIVALKSTRFLSLRNQEADQDGSRSTDSARVDLHWRRVVAAVQRSTAPTNLHPVMVVSKLNTGVVVSRSGIPSLGSALKALM